MSRILVNPTVGLVLLVMVAFVAVQESGCGSPNVYVQVTAPTSATPGSAFTITVTVIANGSQDRIFNAVIHFTSSDPAAVLPADYGFTANDAGSHTFTNGVTLMTLGNQTIKATDDVALSITGSAKVEVLVATTEITPLGSRYGHPNHRAALSLGTAPW